MKKSDFTESEIPYDILAKFGLTQDMVEDLPESVMKSLLAGKRSPALPIFVTEDNGTEIHSRTRIQLIRHTDGVVDVLFYPKHTQAEVSRFSTADAKALNEGYAIVTTDKDGTKVFAQIDPATNQLLTVPTSVVSRNMQIIRDMWTLTDGEMNALQNGKPITLSEGNDLVTVGIDLTDPTAIRGEEGDLERWKGCRMSNIEQYNFGLNGCWIKDEDGNLDYLSDRDYTPEIIEAEKKCIARRSALAMK